MILRLSVLLTLATAGCSAPILAWADHAPAASWIKIRTWAWYPEPANASSTGGILEVNYKRVRNAIAEAMFERGGRLAPFEQADVLVAFHAMVGGMEEEKARRVAFGYEWGTGPAPAPGRQIGEGTLVIDLISNTQPPRLLWHGVASGAVTRGLSAQATVERIEEAVRAVLQLYPPGKP